MAHNTAITFRSVADRLASSRDLRLLAYPITRSAPLVFYVSEAPAPHTLAPVTSQSRNVRNGGHVRNSIRAFRTSFCSVPHGTAKLLAVSYTERLSLGRSEIGVMREL